MSKECANCGNERIMLCTFCHDDNWAQSMTEENARLREHNDALRAECKAWRTAGDNYTGDLRVVVSQWPHIKAIAQARTRVDELGAMDGGGS